MGRKPVQHVMCDRERLKKALRKRELTMMGLSLDSYHGECWMSNMLSKGFLIDDAVELLASYGIKREEYEKHYE